MHKEPKRGLVWLSCQHSLLFLLFLLYLPPAGAQSNFIQSEYVGSPSSTNCATCTLGQVEYRFANQNLGSDSDGDATFNFDVQLRAGSGVEPFDFYTSAAYLSYNTTAFGANAFSGASPACTVTANPATLGQTSSNGVSYSQTTNDNSSDIGTITYRASMGLSRATAAIGSGDYLQIDDTWKTLFNVSCEIANANASAGFAFNALTWDQVSRRSPTTGNVDGSARYVAIADNNLLTNLLFEAPIVTGRWLWQDNRGVDLAFGRAINEPAPSSFWVAQSVTTTALVNAVATTLTGGINLSIEFSGSADAVSNAMLIVSTGGVVSAANAAHTFPSRTALEVLPPSSSDLRITNISLRNVGGGGQYQLQLAVDNFDSYGGAASGFAPGNFTVPGLTVTGVSTDTSGIVLDVTGITRGTSSISVMFANRQTCIGSACIRPIIDSSISTIQSGTPNFPDVFGPVVTIVDADPAPNTIASEATTGTFISGLTLIATDENGNTLTDLTWNGISGFTQFTIATATGIITLTDADNLIGGTATTLVVQATDNATGTQSNELTLEITVTEVVQALRLHIKLLLEAAVDGMAHLQSVLPADDPYCGTGAIGTPTIPSTGAFQDLCENITLTVGQGAGGDSNFPDGVVDWVLVEVRDATDVASATISNAVARKPALLLNNGRVVDAEAFIGFPESDRSACLMASTPTSSGSDPCPAVSFGFAAFNGASPTIANRAFLVMRHRNHLDIQSANAVPLVSNAGSYDFSDSADKTVGGANGIKRLTVSGNPVFAMRMGDANGDGQIQLTDANNILVSNQVGRSGYSLLDINMNNQIQSTDANADILASGNLGFASQVRP